MFMKHAAFAKVLFVHRTARIMLGMHLSQTHQKTHDHEL